MTCKHCGKRIFWMTPDHTPRWVHGVNKTNWTTTPCYHRKDFPVATPALFKEYLKLCVK